jgi:hypothetical protein
MQRSLAFILVAFGVASVSPAQAASGEAIGATLSVINVVTAAFNRDTRTLQTGDDVRQNELIDVSADASTELKLNDDTKLALGPGAKLLLDKFVYDGEKSAGTIGVDLVQGAFRFITGVAAKPSYIVKVPRASITVRGTVFDVFVQTDDTTWLLLHEGGVRVCNERGTCRDHDEPGKLIRITETGDIGRPERWANLDGSSKVPFDSAFPFVVKPPSIDPDPVFTPDQIIKFGALSPEPRRPRRAERETDSNDKPARKKTKAAEENDKPSKKTRSAEDDKKPAKKVVVTPPPKRTQKADVTVKPTKPKTKKPVRQAKNDDEAANKALGLAIGVGIGIGLGKIGGGGGGGGKHMGKRY